MAKKRKANTFAPDGATFLFDELTICRRDGDIFFAGGESNGYQRYGAMTLTYTRQLVAKLTALLAERDAERGEEMVFDDLDLKRVGESVTFTLKAKGEAAASGKVTVEVARKARRLLDELLPPPSKIVPISAGKKN